jgi:hypothetical protein
LLCSCPLGLLNIGMAGLKGNPTKLLHDFSCWDGICIFSTLIDSDHLFVLAF